MIKIKRLLSVVGLTLLLIVCFIPILPTHAAPPDAYWVGNSGNTSDAAHHWASVSGGSANATNIPDATTNIHFDAASFTIAGQATTVDANLDCKSIDFTGVLHNPTLAMANSIEAHGNPGNITLTGITVTGGQYLISSGTCALTTNGIPIAAYLVATGSNTTLQDSLTCSNLLQVSGGTFSTNNKNASTGIFWVEGPNAKTVNLGTSVVACVAVDGWRVDTPASLTLNAGASSIRISGTGTFSGANKTYREVQFNSTANTISGNNTIISLALPSGTIQIVSFTDGTTQTITTATLSGSAGHIHTLQGTGVAGWNLVNLHQIYCMGDSLTAAGVYETQLSSLLGSAWHLNNEGVGGEDTTLMLARFANNVTAPGNGEYVIIWGGINDTIGGATAAAIETNLQSMYTLAHAAGLKVVAINITPFKGNVNWTAPKQAVLDSVNSWIASAAPTSIDYKIDMYSLLEDPANPDYLLPAYDDGITHIHLSILGYNLVGTTIYNSLGIATFPVAQYYVSISYSGASPANTWYANGASINGGNNTGWNFPITITTQTATNVGMGAGTYATLNGVLTDMGGTTPDTAYFEWGYGTGYGNTLVSHSLAASASFADTITGFDPNQTVHFRANAVSGITTVNGADSSFGIGSSAPSSPSFVAFNFANGVVPVLFVAFVIFVVMMLALGGAVSPLFAIILMGVAILMGMAFLQGIQALLNAMWGG